MQPVDQGTGDRIPNPKRVELLRSDLRHFKQGLKSNQLNRRTSPAGLS